MKPIHIVLCSLLAALRHPGVLLLCWLAVTVPALLAVYPAAHEVHLALSTHPGASYALDRTLDADLARLRPDALVSMKAAALFVLLAFAFLAGGILTGVGQWRRPHADFMASCGRHFFRNLRVLLIGIPICALVFWGTGALERKLWQDWFYDSDPGTVLSLLHEALRYAYGLLFLCIVFVGKMAMAQLTGMDRRSALLAWLRSGRIALRHPLRTTVIVGLLAAVALLISLPFGWAIEQALEVHGSPWLGLAFGQLFVGSLQVVLVAFFLSARALVQEAVPSEAPAG